MEECRKLHSVNREETNYNTLIILQDLTYIYIYIYLYKQKTLKIDLNSFTTRTVYLKIEIYQLLLSDDI